MSMAQPNGDRLRLIDDALEAVIDAFASMFSDRSPGRTDFGLLSGHGEQLSRANANRSNYIVAAMSSNMMPRWSVCCAAS
jgi:hypothetical protein